MKKYFRTTLIGIVAVILITTGCRSTTYAQNDSGYYYDYGDGQPGGYYDDGQQSIDQGSQMYQSQPPVGFNDFVNQLSPYGVWVNIAPYGQVWIANVPNFQPYSTNGYWAYTTYGWTWVSNYPWGWAPFHYGRWGYNSRFGWYWVPGYVWGPAWVAWSSSADMYGWAPLMPGMNFGVNLSISLFPPSYWTFMQGRYMGNMNIGGFYINRSRNVNIIKNTVIINNYARENNRRYSMGPSANDVQRFTGRTSQPMRVSNATDSRSAGVSNDEMRVYRPVSRPTASDRTTAPDNNNRPSNSQTRPQTNQPSNRPANRPSNTQQDQPSNRPANRPSNVQQDQPSNRPANTQQNQSTTPSRQNATQREYRPNPAQPAVTNKAAPQTTRQIQSAQKDNSRMQQQQRSSTPARSNTNTQQQPRR
jgi:hypothetical protein